jgi:hypothetical protein
MKKFLIAMFSQSTEVSESRVMSMMVCVTACFAVLHGILVIPVDYNGIALLSGTLFGIAFSGKVASRYAEVADKKAGTVTTTTEIKNA